MRKRDLHILTSNIYTYTGDQRFSVIHAPESEDWDLKIEYVQPRDSGIYECQVNTEPKINLAVLLHVTGTDGVLRFSILHAPPQNYTRDRPGRRWRRWSYPLGSCTTLYSCRATERVVSCGTMLPCWRRSEYIVSHYSSPRIARPPRSLGRLAMA